MTFLHDFVPPSDLRQIDDDQGRRYALPDGTCYPSVTTILGELPNEGLAKWRQRVGDKAANKEQRRTASRGTALHTALNRYLMNEPVTINTSLVQMLFKQVRPTLNALGRIRLLEQPLYSHKLRMAGTPDCVADWSDVLSVVDFKTSNRPKQERYLTGYYCQVGAYAHMFNERYGVLPEQGVIVVAVEESPVPQVFRRPINECFDLLKDYVRRLTAWRKSLKDQAT